MSRYVLTACIALDIETGPAFLLPVFAAESHPGVFVQAISAARDKVTHFVELAENAGELQRLPSGTAVSEGDPPLFVFRTGRDVFVCGPLNELKSTLKDIMFSSVPAGVKLQIADLIGSVPEKLAARRAAFKEAQIRLSNEHSARAFSGSALIQSLWDNLLGAASGPQAVEQLARYRRTIVLSANFDSETMLPDDLWNTIGPLLTVDRSALRARIEREFPDSVSLRAEGPPGSIERRSTRRASQSANVSTAFKRRGLLYALSSPTGVGRTTIARMLLARDAGIEMPLSVTTRPVRRGEEDGISYRFVSGERFDEMVSEGAFLEWASLGEHRYGTLKREVVRIIEAGRDVLLDVDWQGAQQLARVDPDIVRVCILPPSMKELERRLRTRGEDTEDLVVRRIEQAQFEISHWAEYDYVLINNDAEKCCELVHNILRAERLKSVRRVSLHDFVRDLLDDISSRGVL